LILLVLSLCYVRMFIVYRPPYYDSNAISYASLLIECIKKYSTNNKYVHLIIGDFNLLQANWDVLAGPDDECLQHHFKLLPQ